MSEDYEKQVETVQAVLGNLQTERFELEKGVPKIHFWRLFRKYKNIDKRTREILIGVVDYIKAYEGGNISIRFKFADEYRRVTEYIEANIHAEAI